MQSGSSSAVECLLAKEEVASSNLVFRSTEIKLAMDVGAVTVSIELSSYLL